MKEEEEENDNQDRISQLRSSGPLPECSLNLADIKNLTQNRTTTLLLELCPMLGLYFVAQEFTNVDYVVCETDDLRRAQKSHGRDGHHSHDPRAAQLLEWKFCQCSSELSPQSTPGYHFLPARSVILTRQGISGIQRKF